jgi:hypothetical protein
MFAETGQFLTFDATHTQKPKLYNEYQLQKPKNESFTIWRPRILVEI